jgi:RHS repeat-associated protein
MTIGTSGPYSFSYDPLMRMATIPGSRYLRFGDQLIGEYSNGNVAGRYVPGAGLDEPVAAISGSGVRDWRIADERGSIMAHSDASGAAPYVNRYDEYGRESTTQYGRFGFTGLPRLTGPLLDARNRLYHAEIGRFLQPDPIGYGDGMNLYAYVGGDPVNARDPLGTEKICTSVPQERGKWRCVLVDHDGDGDSSDDDMNEAQKDQILADYGGFIVQQTCRSTTVWQGRLGNSPRLGEGQCSRCFSVCWIHCSLWKQPKWQDIQGVPTAMESNILNRGKS